MKTKQNKKKEKKKTVNFYHNPSISGRHCFPSRTPFPRQYPHAPAKQRQNPELKQECPGQHSQRNECDQQD
jgi:hypothetical protein